MEQEVVEGGEKSDDRVVENDESEFAESPSEEPEKVNNRARLLQPEVVPIAPQSDDARMISEYEDDHDGGAQEEEGDDRLGDDSDFDANYDTAGSNDDFSSIGQFQSCGSVGTDNSLSPIGPAE